MIFRSTKEAFREAIRIENEAEAHGYPPVYLCEDLMRQAGKENDMDRRNFLGCVWSVIMARECWDYDTVFVLSEGGKETGNPQTKPEEVSPMSVTNLKERIEKIIKSAEQEVKDDPAHIVGRDWWQITEAEEDVFSINRERFPRMMMAWACYEVFVGITEPDVYDIDPDILEEARQQRPDIYNGGVSAKWFSTFAQEYANITPREASAIYYKHEFWLVRAGVVHYADEPRMDMNRVPKLY